LENYAKQFELHPHFGQMATNIEQIDGLWQVTTTNGRYLGRNLVIATGHTNQPVLPSWPGQDQFKGQIMHSSQYKNGAALAGKHVLVVGFGNSGGEIAIDLHECGALPSISVRNAVNVIPRDILGIPILSIGILMSKLPTAVADLLAAPLLKLTIGDLTRYGLKKLPYGPNTQIARDGRIPLLDIGTVSLIKQGSLQVKPAIERFEPEGVQFVGGQSQAYEAVVLATGYQPNLEVFANGIGPTLDDKGQPLCSGQESSLTGLYFCGFYISPTGMLREIGIEARQIGQSIKAKKRSADFAD
jgi:cation diffusion facilitator CzcD-associated flavoprotein CzcO